MKKIKRKIYKLILKHHFVNLKKYKNILMIGTEQKKPSSLIC